jgi:hypothetical protein
LDKLASSIERRRVRRLKVRCEFELCASLSLLDNDISDTDSSLVFLGRTQDVSACRTRDVPSFNDDRRAILLGHEPVEFVATRSRVA